MSLVEQTKAHAPSIQRIHKFKKWAPGAWNGSALTGSAFFSQTLSDVVQCGTNELACQEFRYAGGQALCENNCGNTQDGDLVFRTLAIVPEPGAALLLSLGLIGLAGTKRCSEDR